MASEAPSSATEGREEMTSGAAAPASVMGGNRARRASGRICAAPRRPRRASRTATSMEHEMSTATAALTPASMAALRLMFSMTVTEAVSVMKAAAGASDKAPGRAGCGGQQAPDRRRRQRAVASARIASWWIISLRTSETTRLARRLRHRPAQCRREGEFARAGARHHLDAPRAVLRHEAAQQLRIEICPRSAASRRQAAGPVRRPAPSPPNSDCSSARDALPRPGGSGRHEELDGAAQPEAPHRAASRRGCGPHGDVGELRLQFVEALARAFRSRRAAPKAG